MNRVFLDALTREDCLAVAVWRNTPEVRPGLRTPYVLTDAMQESFYETVVADRSAPHRYWAVRSDTDGLVAMAGLTDIEWENGHGEISLIVAPARLRHGTGAIAVALLLHEAFDAMRLATVFGEVYETNEAIGFWHREVARYGGGGTTVPRRKWHAGELRDAWFFWVTAEGWQASKTRAREATP